MSSIVATVYSRPSCQRCRTTERALNRAGVTVVSELIDDHPDALDALARLGSKELPYVAMDTGDEELEWSGYSQTHIDRVTKLAKQTA